MARGAPGRDEAAAQLAALRQLHQQPAALLVGWTPRGLRDSDAPRRKDGTYDGPKLVKWALDRQRAKLKPSDSKATHDDLQREKLREARRRNDVEEGLLVETQTVGQILHDVFATWREQVQKFEAKYGKPAGDEIREMIERAFEESKDLRPEPAKEPKIA